jgi:hypothetical protein
MLWGRPTALLGTYGLLHDDHLGHRARHDAGASAGFGPMAAPSVRWCRSADGKLRQVSRTFKGTEKAAGKALAAFVTETNQGKVEKTSATLEQRVLRL